jgi:hypothetical protein
LAAIAKLNGALCRALPASAATATLNGSNASAEKLKAHVPNHCLTEPDFALDFIAHDLCRTHGMRMTRSFSHYTDGVRVYLIRILKLFSKHFDRSHALRGNAAMVALRPQLM